MISCQTIEELRRVVGEARRQGQKISFVPTMGYLHDGHLSLVDRGREKGGFSVVSIFVNPAQFNDPSDLDKYPRDFERDADLLRERGVDCVFYPSPELMYSDTHESWVELEQLPLPLEGQGRPGHFRGVTTVVTMLFNIVQPDFAVFGEKDFQQLRVIEKMVQDLKVPVEILRGALVREADGIAMSSRNVRLSAADRKKALAISRGLFAARAIAQAGEKDASKVLACYLAETESIDDLELFYAAVIDEETLAEIDQIQDSPARLLTSVGVGGVRLLDNIGLNSSR